MANNFLNPEEYILDSTGQPRAAGILYFYINTTTTLTSIYSDEALTVAQTNPYTLDAYGRVPGDIHFQGLVTVKITNADGSDVITYDNVTSSETSAALRGDLASTALDDGTKGFNLVYRPLSQDESDAGITPINYQYDYGDPLRYGAAGDGGTIDTTALQTAIDYAVYVTTKVRWSRRNYVIDAALTIDGPIQLDGNFCQIYQQTANVDGIRVDKGTAVLATNVQNSVLLENIILGTNAGTGNAFVFRNMNESNVRNLFVPYTGNIAFRIQGCLLSYFENLYTGNGLSAEPGFFKSAGLTANTTGFSIESYNGAGPNNNTYNRCTATNSTSKAFDIQGGVASTWINCDAEGITAPAIGMYLGGVGNNVIGGDFEGSGDSIQVWANGCTISGVNALAGVIIESGVTGTCVRGGQIKILNFVAGSSNNSADGVTILTTGVFVDSGTDNLAINIYDTDTAADKGYFRSGTFTPDLEFGGASGVSAYTSLAASWWRHGKIVNFSIFIRPSTYTAATGSATINMNDIPFTPRAGSETFPVSLRWNGVPAGAGYSLSADVQPGAKTIALERILDTTGAATAIDETFFSANDQFKIAGWFPVA